MKRVDNVYLEFRNSSVFRAQPILPDAATCAGKCQMALASQASQASASTIGIDRRAEALMEGEAGVCCITCLQDSSM